MTWTRRKPTALLALVVAVLVELASIPPRAVFVAVVVAVVRSVSCRLNVPVASFPVWVNVDPVVEYTVPVPPAPAASDHPPWLIVPVDEPFTNEVAELVLVPKMLYDPVVAYPVRVIVPPAAALTTCIG